MVAVDRCNHLLHLCDYEKNDDHSRRYRVHEHHYHEIIAGKKPRINRGTQYTSFGEIGVYIIDENIRQRRESVLKFVRGKPILELIRDHNWTKGILSVLFGGSYLILLSSQSDLE